MHLYVTSGKASTKLIPPNYTKYLNIKNDYENAEFRSPINPWNVDPRDRADFNKVKVLESLACGPGKNGHRDGDAQRDAAAR